MTLPFVITGPYYGEILNSQGAELSMVVQLWNEFENCC